MSSGGSIGSGLSYNRSKSKSKTTAKRELDVTETINRLSEGGREALDSLIELLGDTSQVDMIAEAKVKNEGLTKEQAVKDSAAAVQNIMQKSAEEIFPKLYEAQQGSGAYNATSAQLLADNAQARAAAEGAAVQMDTIQKYEALANQNLQTAIAGETSQVEQLLGALGLDSEAVAEIKKSERETGKSTSTGRSNSFSTSVAGSYNYN